MTREAKTILARFDGDRDKAAEYALRIIHEYREILDAIREPEERTEAATA